MNIIHEETVEYPLSAPDVIARHPEISFPIPFELAEGYAWVGEVLPPEHDPITQRAAELDPVREGDGWVQAWEIEGLDPDTIAANQQAAAAAVISAVTADVQQRLDAFAQERRYDNMISLCSYATDPDPAHAAEGRRGVLLRSQVWNVLKGIERDVLAGTRPMPTYEEAIAELPPLTWEQAPEGGTP